MERDRTRRRRLVDLAVHDRRAGDGHARLEYWFQMGPGRGGLNYAIEAMPDKEERIVARRMEEHRVNMARVLDGVKALAEGASA